MKQKILFTVLIMFQIFAFSQEKASVNASWVGFDYLDNQYIINKQKLTKISSNKSEKQYQNNFLGQITSVDISNPLRLLVFHKDANQIVFLDRQLIPIADAISLDELSLFDVDWVCNASIDGFWVLNKSSHRLEFYNEKLEKIHTSMDLGSFINQADNIMGLKIFQDRLYLNIKNRGILVFDMFASYIKIIPIKNSLYFQITSNFILYSQDNTIVIRNRQKSEIQSFIKLQNKAKTFFYNHQHLYYFSGDSIFKYESINWPIK